jgi:hypothetical protein
LHIVFGWHLDGASFPETADGAHSSLDSAVVGPLGLLNLLEAKIGLNGPNSSPAVRIAQYLSRLQAVDDGERFFSGSLAADGWATARLLLALRDELASGGWTPGQDAWRSERLGSLAAVEHVEGLPLAPGNPDRVRAIMRCVAIHNPIGRLAIVDQIDHLPLVWRRLVDALRSGGTEVSQARSGPGAEGSDLAAIQARLVRGAAGVLSGDMSFAVVRCDDELTGAEIAAAWLSAVDDANDDVVIIRQADSTILDGACHRLGLPRPGGSARSPYRGALQVLPLAFETSWTPVHAGRLLELLMMPGSPVRPSVARIFADVLRDFPGIDGPRWRDAWNSAVSRFRERLAKSEGDVAALDKAVAEEQANWRAWLEPNRYDRARGMSAADADAVCQRVQRWASRRAGATEEPIYHDVANAAAALADTISASRLASITKTQLDRMIDTVIADGVPLPWTVAEAAAWTGVDGPEQVWGPVPRVLWWGFADPGTRPRAAPWTDSEREELAERNCSTPTVEDRLALDTAAHRRAILNATRSVMCIMPMSLSGESAAAHPIWHEIRGIVENSANIFDARSAIDVPQVEVGGRWWAQQPIQARTLPAPLRNWSAPAGAIGPRERESATSIESLLGCPLNWVLQYRAGIRESSLLDIADGNRLKGNIAHAVIARLFSEPIPADESVVRSRAAVLVDELLPQIGSIFLLPGRVRDREDVRRNSVESAVALFQIIRDSGLSVVGVEQAHEAHLDEQTTLNGIVDLELQDTNGRPVVVDLKWSNSDRYRHDEISEGRPVQLATYSQLLRRSEAGGLPSAAYFMLKQRRLLAIAQAPFPSQFWIEGTDLESTWGAIRATRRAALDQLAAGSVVATGIESDEISPSDVSDLDLALTIEPPCRFCGYGRLCGQRGLK